MRFHSLMVTLFLAVLSSVASAQKLHTVGEKQEAPPAVERIIVGVPTNSETLSALLRVNPQIPLGPEYVLQGYENDMTLVGERMSAELTNIGGALRAGRITRAEAEYLIQENYQVALMQYQVFSALHDALAQDIARVAARAKTLPQPPGSDTAVVVYAPAAASSSGAQ